MSPKKTSSKRLIRLLSTVVLRNKWVSTGHKNSEKVGREQEIKSVSTSPSELAKEK